ncbi:MAG: DNA primase [Pikeienuella sp.]
MGFPPHFLDALRERLTLSDIVGGKVTWDRRKSAPARGDWWAPCPFHQEKTASFHVDDRKGFYHCFGCKASGDAITFVKETENLSFPEAVERLAAHVGLEVPRSAETPQDRAKRDRIGRLGEAMEAAVAAFGRAFRAAGGAEARGYAARRGLTAATLERFEIGYAPAARGYLTDLFRGRDSVAEAIEAGLLIAPEDGGAPFDRFRDRLIFPIRDAKGRCIALGGRALGQGAKAKYLNSPETPLFSKGRVLYNHGPAREAAGKAGRVVVAEGYMDVIALAQAGIDEAVAPLGTAVTVDQLNLLWRMASEPVFALDGDTAGLRAAHRAIDLALPLLSPGRTCRFCLMPAGQDPDDLIKAEGRAGMEAALAAAIPLDELLWRRELAEHPLDTPERRAALKRRLEAAAAKIQDRDLADGYRDNFRQRLRRHLWELDRPAARSGRGPWRGAVAPGPLGPTKASPLARDPAPEAAQHAREATILAIALANPAPATELFADLDAMPVTDPHLEPVRNRLLAALEAGECPDLDAVDPDGLVGTARLAHPLARAGADPGRVRLVLAEAIAHHAARCNRAAELAEAAEDLDTAQDEGWTWRLREVGNQCAAAQAAALRAEEAARAATKRSRIADLLETYRRGQKKKRGDPPSNH